MSAEKVAIVTGAARGIGEAISIRLAKECHVVVADVSEAVEKVAEKIRSMGRQSLSVTADVSKGDDVDILVDRTLKTFGQIDILVNNAGITRDNLLMRMTEEEWDRVIQINLRGAFLCTQKVIRSMMKRRFGKIINISSVVGVTGNAGQANYAASKAGLIGFTKSVAKEVASRNIQVNAVAPGFIQTAMTEHLPEDIKTAFLENIPAKRAGSPEDVAGVVAFLSSPDSDYVTGQVIHIDGGMVM